MCVILDVVAVVRATDRSYIERDASVGAMTFSGSESELREKWLALEAAGASEVFYSPAGPDIPRELHAMARAIGVTR